MQLGNAVAWESVCTTGYAAAILAFSGESANLLGSLLNEWIAFADPFVRTVIFFLPEPAKPTDTPSPVAIYQHILVSSLLIAATWIWASRTSWESWAKEVYSPANQQALPGSQRNLLQYAHSVMILGLLSAILLLLFLGTDSRSAESWLVTEKWTYFRAPLLGTAFFVFTCHVIAIRRLLESRLAE
jgi:hypothetical protein